MAYNRVNWINEQEGTTTPLNAENLNTMDEGISNLDERVTVLEESQGGDIVERVEALETDNATNKTNIANLDGRVEVLENDNETIKQDVEDIGSYAGSLSVKIKDIELKDQQFDDDIYNLNASINQTKLDVNALDNRVYNLEHETKLTDAFSTVVANGTNITASGSDSFKLKAGSNVNITANATTKEITISSTGGGGGGGGVPESIIADAWNSATDYTKGMYCMDSGLMWKCLADNTNEQPTEGTYWTSKTVGEGLSNLTADDGLDFRFATDGAGNYGYLGADDSFIPFKKGTSYKGYYIPFMTANDAPYGTASSPYTPYKGQLYLAFDDDDTTYVSGQRYARYNDLYYTNQGLSCKPQKVKCHSNITGNVTVYGIKYPSEQIQIAIIPPDGSWVDVDTNEKFIGFRFYAASSDTNTNIYTAQVWGDVESFEYPIDDNLVIKNI